MSAIFASFALSFLSFFGKKKEGEGFDRRSPNGLRAGGKHV